MASHLGRGLKLKNLDLLEQEILLNQCCEVCIVTVRATNPRERQPTDNPQELPKNYEKASRNLNNRPVHWRRRHRSTEDGDHRNSQQPGND